ncbi:hypothetical protein HDU67_005075 [Dinochytrium kinnereticum]|nr:hypothetical protein HDU67_005075 [Dinochytrium kinnereticum]
MPWLDILTLESLLQYLDNCAQDPNSYHNYLSLILAKQGIDPSDDVREMAGLLLKGGISKSENRGRLSKESWDFCTRAALFAVQDPSSAARIQKTASIVLPAIVAYEPKQAKSVIESLFHFAQQPQLVEPTLKCFVTICEDTAEKLEDELILAMASVCIQHFDHDGTPKSPLIRSMAISAANHIAFHKSQVLKHNNFLQLYVTGLYRRANDQDPEVKKNVCQGFVIALEADASILNLRDLIPYMLMCTSEANHQIALEACEFWLALAEHDMEMYMDILEPHLPKLIATLLRGMVYTDEEIANLGADEESNVEDRPEDIQPRFHKAKSHAFEGTDDQKKAQQKQDGQIEDDDDDDDDDGDDDDEDPGVSSWTLRKCSAAALDMMATVYAENILQFFLPELKTLLEYGSRSAQNWKELECGILALGAVAEGCRDYIQQFLPDLVKFMFTNCLKHPQPLVRSITCWTLGRYSQWIVRGFRSTPMNAQPMSQDEHLQTFFAPSLQHILALVIDKNKRVQQAGCSALATLEEEACEYLVPYLGVILPHMSHAFTIYQKKNLLILYDAVGTLADAVGLELNKPEHIPVLMQPLINKWQTTYDDNRDIFPLFECLSSVAIALGNGFAPFAKNVWDRCVGIIGQTLHATQQFAQNPGSIEEPDLDFVIVSLDLLSGIAQGLKREVSPLVSSTQPPLMEIVFVCMQNPSHEVRQSAYALLGDLSSASFENVAPYLQKTIPLIIDQIARKEISDELSVCNNATWAAGEIALQLGESVAPFVGEMIKRLVPILADDNSSSRKITLIENAAITVGRLAYVYPNGISPILDQFLMHWCRALRGIPDNLEKESAFLGLCKVAVTNPTAVYTNLSFFCDAIVRWDNTSPTLHSQLSETLMFLKNTFGPQWNEKASSFPVEVRERLAARFQIV